MTAFFSDLSPQQYQQHPLHGADRAWPETNCYADLWIEVLSAWGTVPEAMLGFTLTQDYEGDQFTFFKVPLEDLESLYQVLVTELALYDTVENHVSTQLSRHRLCLVELDSFYLPDTAGVTYGLEHGKTTVGINRLDSDAATMDYFHNGGFFRLEGADYAGAFQHHVPFGERWIPYTEFAKFPAQRPSEEQLRTEAHRLLRHHLGRRPGVNPLAAFAEVFPAQVEQIADRGLDFFHLYAFNTVRQFGANFELLASHLSWLDADGFSTEVSAARQIADTAKSTQFLLARAVARRRFAPLADALRPAADAWDELIAGLQAKVD